MIYVLQNLHWFVLLIGALIFFHELGHFLVAKACGVKVLRFSLGFGPKLIGIRKGETEYQISLFPLGGYVKMLGELPGMDTPAEDRDRALSAKPVWQRSAILAAGPAFNFLLAFLVYVFMFTGHQTLWDTKLGVVSYGQPAWNAGLRPGDRIVAVNGVEVDRWDQLRDLIGSQPGRTLKLTYRRGEREETVSISPEAQQEANLFNETETRGRIGVSLLRIKPIVAVVDRESPAARAGLQTGDVIAKVSGQPVDAWHEVRDAMQAVPAGQSAELTIRRGEEELVLSVIPEEHPDGLDPELFSAADTAGGYTGIVSRDTVVHEVKANTPAEQTGLQPGDRLLALKIQRPDGETRERPIGTWGIDLAAFSGVDARSTFTLRIQRNREVMERTFSLEARVSQDELKNTYTQYVFGAHNAPDGAENYTFERDVGIWEAVVTAARQTAQDTTLIAKGLRMMAGGELSLDNMGGPIMLFVIAEKTAKQGWESFLRTMAVISVNLGLLNLLPIPVLDGGHLMFFAIEAVRRRPPSLRTREVANLVGLAILVMLMVLAFKNDIVRYLLG